MAILGPSALVARVFTSVAPDPAGTMFQDTGGQLLKVFDSQGRLLGTFLFPVDACESAFLTRYSIFFVGGDLFEVTKAGHALATADKNPAMSWVI
jgi:hypothetical protein